VCGYSDIESQLKTLMDWPPSEEYITNCTLENSSVSNEWNNEYFKQIRKSFLNNKWPENCNRCKHVEDLNGVSKRMDENHMWFDKYEHLIETTDEGGEVDYQPPHLDVRTGTVCNFKCIHCSPASSSKWVEDIELIKQYGFEYRDINNKWISQDNDFWDSLDISQIKRYNFLGGESFYNKRHNEFIKRLNKSPFAKDVEIAYVSNGSLKFENMENFKKVRLRLSVDCVERAGEYFRFGLNWKQWTENIKDFPSNFDVSFQWTCSNVSMFYLIDTYDYLREEFPNIRFLFGNHVTEPYHMSVQNLPIDIKNEIKKNIDSYMFTKESKEVLPFYINHMFEKNSWNSHGKVLLNYLNDLDEARNIDWRTSFSEMCLEKYVE
jgi:MoaA/NifB/PqqE/SkfB family radical SAM enzyme